MKYLNSANEHFLRMLVPIRDGFGKGLVELAEKNDKVVGMCADLTESTRMDAFASKFPDRFFEAGVSEQNMIGVAAGLALAGKIPFATSYAVFSPGRTWDQIRVSVCYTKSNVKIVGAHAGVTVGPDGATHQALEDIAIMRVLPNMTVIVPADALEAQKATLALGLFNGPAYLRLSREKSSVVTTSATPFKIGKALTMLEGKDVTIIACGLMVAVAIEAAQKLEDKYQITVINMHTIKPLDTETVLHAAKKTGAIVTAEEHQIAGGLGSAVAEYLSESCPTPVVRVGVNDRFGESGTPQELMDHYGLGVRDMIEAVEKAVNFKNNY